MTLDVVTSTASPKDRFVTVYGRKPVLEALSDMDLRVDKVIIAEGLGGAMINQIKEAAADRAVRGANFRPARTGKFLDRQPIGTRCRTSTHVRDQQPPTRRPT